MQIENLRQHGRIQVVGRIATSFDQVAKGATWVGVAYFVYMSVAVAAGKTTHFDSAVHWVFQADMSRWAGWALAAIFGGATYRERRLRKKEVANLSATVKDLELLHDPSRSSSGLNAEGLPASSVEVHPQLPAKKKE